MPTLCLVVVTQLRTNAVDGRERYLKKTRNKSNDYFESLQYREDVRHIAHYHKRKHFPSYTRCTENHNNVSIRKSRSWHIFSM